MIFWFKNKRRIKRSIKHLNKIDEKYILFFHIFSFFLFSPSSQNTQRMECPIDRSEVGIKPAIFFFGNTVSPVY
jgi:hypothetical protein